MLSISSKTLDKLQWRSLENWCCWTPQQNCPLLFAESGLHLIQTSSAVLSWLWTLLNRIFLIIWKKNCLSPQTLLRNNNSSIWRADFLLQLRKQQRWLLVTSNVQTILVMSSLSLVCRFACRSLSCYFFILPYVSLNIFFFFTFCCDEFHCLSH